MNNNKEVDPENLGGLGDMLPADVLEKLNQLLEMLHQTEGDKKGSTVINIYAQGSQHVDTQINIKASPTTPASPLTPLQRVRGTLRARGVDSSEASKSLPEVLATDEAMAMWRKAMRAGYVDEHYQPIVSRPEAAVLAYEMAKRLGIEDKWKAFETLWNRRNMYRDYHTAINQKKSLKFRDDLKAVLG